MRLITPYAYKVDTKILGNGVQQIGEGSQSLDGMLANLALLRDDNGFTFTPSSDYAPILLAPKRQFPAGQFSHVLLTDAPVESDQLDLSADFWLRHPASTNTEGVPSRSETDAVLDSWIGTFSFLQGDESQNIVGFRHPQIGAIHAAHAHWSVSEDPATIVMPTGTGKTETMLGILVSSRCRRLLVVVPTDALRSQIFHKFVTLGLLKAAGSQIMTPGSLYPIVCSLRHIPKSLEEVEEIFGCSQVIVSTSSIVGRASPEVQQRMADMCSHLFIDEAHHTEATTWRSFRSRFAKARVMQFTATPFRDDGKVIDGQIIYRYPLRRAQAEGYFKPIRFSPIVEFGKKNRDLRIAERAVEQLAKDYDKGHVVMARVDSIKRAEEVHEIYRRHFAKYNPVQLHTGIGTVGMRKEILRKVLSGESRIIVCVDMLGEGFDLPELKIAAFHDVRKSLAVTLQLAGRFTRVKPNLGDAVFIANTADADVQGELRKLYTQDPDWNALLPSLSDRMTGEQIDLQEFLQGFEDISAAFSLKGIRPAISTVIYQTKCRQWLPENFRRGLPNPDQIERIEYSVNANSHILVIVTARREPLPWINAESLQSRNWELHVVVWSPHQHLLYVNSSTNAGEYKALAQAVCGDEVELISGMDVFRSFSGVNRLRLRSVGLSEVLGRNVSYTNRMGSDVGTAISDMQRKRALKSVLSGTGYENGERVTVGASRRGRIWTHRRDRLDQLVQWCKRTGDKVLDASIDPDSVLAGTLSAKTIFHRPPKMPITVDWPEIMYSEPSSFWSVNIDGNECAIDEVDLEIADYSTDGPLEFAVSDEKGRVLCRLSIDGAPDQPTYHFVLSKASLAFRHGSRADWQPADEFFFHYPPVIRFVDGSYLEGNQYIELKEPPAPYGQSGIEGWDWTGVDIRKESQRRYPGEETVQSRVIKTLMTREYQIVFDDDDAGEAADVVAIKLEGEISDPREVCVDFYHCKFSAKQYKGARVDDLYVLCGQAQTSVSWMSSQEKMASLFDHLLRREASLVDSAGASRFHKGDRDLLITIREVGRVCRISLRIFAVQPGLSKAAASVDQLQLLGVTQTYLMETYQVPFGLIASA